GAGPNAIWPATPSTSVPRSSACPSTTPCAKSREPKPEKHTAPIAGIVAVRCQYGTLTAKRIGLQPYDGNAESTLGLLAKSKPDQPHHSATIRARQFGTKLRRQFGTNPQTATAPIGDK